MKLKQSDPVISVERSHLRGEMSLVKRQSSTNTKHLLQLSRRVAIFLCSVLSVAVFVLFNTKIFELHTIQNVLDARYVASQDDGSGQNFQMHKVCRCPRAEHRPRPQTLVNGRYVESTCSDHATARGPGQKVITYSFYGTVSNRYFNGTEYNVRTVKQLYPGWVMRLYHNISMDDEGESKDLCRIWCDNGHFDVCDVHHLPPMLGDQSTIFGMLWRFLVLGDPLVDVFLVRDLDSVIIQREVDAVHQWLNDKNKPTWHIMRDHMYHGVHILGGMWGGMNRNLTLTTTLRQQFIDRGQKWQKGYDQHLLSGILWPWAQHDMVSHDSYYCQYFSGAQPWPTRRNGTEFVGDTFPWLAPTFVITECPTECRPKKHQDWFLC